MNIPSFPPRFDSDLVRPFYDGLAQGELRISACAECGRFHWYPPDVLPCHPTASLVWRPVSPDGTVYSFTTIERSVLPGGAGANTPYTIVLVEPDEVPGARVPALFVASGQEQPACGMRVTLHPVDAGEYVMAGFKPL